MVASLWKRSGISISTILVQNIGFHAATAFVETGEILLGMD
jgi:hypothetical protein